MENDTRRGLKATIEDVKPIFRPVLPRTSNDTILCVNWATVIAAVASILFAYSGWRGIEWAWFASVAFAFISGVLYGVYFEDDEQGDEIDEDEILDDAYRANDEHDERTDLIRRLTY